MGGAVDDIAPAQHRLKNAAIRSSQRWIPITDWMLFFCSIGRLLVESTRQGPLKIGISVPTLDYSAVFTTVGAVLTAAELGSAASLDSETHFQNLRSLPAGTPVKWRRDGKVLKGLLKGAGEGVAARKGEPYLKVQIAEAGGLTYSCYQDDCLEIQPAAVDAVVKVPKNPPIRRMREKKKVQLLDLLLSPEGARRHLRRDLVAVIIGSKGRVVEETAALEIALSQNNQAVSMTAAQLLQLNESASLGSCVVYGIQKGSIARAGQLTRAPQVVVFDGARAYELHRMRWADSPSVVLLDRGDPASSNAASTFTAQKTLYGRPATLPDSMQVPCGVDLDLYL